VQDKVLTVLLIEDSPDYAALVQRWLALEPEKTGFILNWTDSLEAGQHRLAQGGVDVILLDLSLPDSDGLNTFTAVRTHSSTLPIIVLSGADGELLALQMIQQGAQDYLVKSTCTAELLTRALRYAVIRHNSQPAVTGPEDASGQRRVIGVLGSAGGVGATTVACVLAADLRHLTDQSVLLADLGLNDGMVSMMSGVSSKYSLLDAIGNLDRLDREFWYGLVAHRAGDLDILPSPVLMGESGPDPEVIQQVFRRVRRYYDWMVLDLGCLDRLAASVAGWSTDVLLVTALSIPSLHQCKRTLDALQKIGIHSKQVRLVVNQRGEKCDLSPNELQNMFGAEVFATLPPSHEELHNAFMHKRLPAISSNFRKELTLAARKMSGKLEEKPKGMLRPLASIADRFRRGREIAPEAAAR
jgi:Flp pilus assembly CpaE family ATPase